MFCVLVPNTVFSLAAYPSRPRNAFGCSYPGFFKGASGHKAWSGAGKGQRMEVTKSIGLWSSSIFGDLSMCLEGPRLLTGVLSTLQLTACLHASAALLYPMFWQHIYIPVLPPHLLDYCW